jgi:hypothetical protein
MGRRDARVDDYIARAAEFAKPILAEIRERVHAACPGVQETIKWSVPHFDYKGIMCRMAAFKQHCAVGFWKGSLVVGDAAGGAGSRGRLGRITSLNDLPSKSLFRGHIRKAMALNDSGEKVARPPGPPKVPVVVPGYFTTAIRKNRKAHAAFDAFSSSHRREYVKWVTEAKTDATRSRRLAQAVEWLAQGKPRNRKQTARPAVSPRRPRQPGRRRAPL